MKRKKTVIFSGIILIVAVCAIGLFTQSPKWSETPFYYPVVYEIRLIDSGKQAFIVINDFKWKEAIAGKHIFPLQHI